MNSHTRLIAALLVILAIAFAQVAVAAYSCPGPEGMARAAIASQEEMPECEETPALGDLAALCQAHCQQGDLSIDRTTAPVFAAAMPAEPFTLRLELARVAVATAALPSLLARPTGPPAAVRHCRFLI